MRSYQLRFILKQTLILEIGKLGRFKFPAGEYVYTGSAKRNIDARISRHLSKRKKLRWHIDYLLATSYARIIRVDVFDIEECVVNQETEGEILVPRFGATDCKNDCGSHLKFRGQTQKKDSCWNEFIVEASFNSQHDVIFLKGLPDLPKTLPHAKGTGERKSLNNRRHRRQSHRHSTAVIFLSFLNPLIQEDLYDEETV